MRDIESNIVAVKSKAFAIRCVLLCRMLQESRREYFISRQLIRSGTSIGANIKEALRAQTRPDFRAKLNISLKEASETEYWIELLRDTSIITSEEAESMLNDCVELLKLLTSILKSTSTPTTDL